MNDFGDLMIDTVSHARPISRDGYGKSTFGADSMFLARITHGYRAIRSATGNFNMSRGIVWIINAPTINADDRLTLPDGDTPPILNIARFFDDSGAHHTKVYFG